MENFNKMKYNCTHIGVSEYIQFDKNKKNNKKRVAVIVKQKASKRSKAGESCGQDSPSVNNA